MAYCSNCGAYIPDGQTVCPACGIDAAQPPRAPGIDEAEKGAPKAAEKNKTSTSERKGETATADKPVTTNVTFSNSRLFAVLSYVSILCFLPFLLCPNDDFARYHGKQGILLLIVSALIDLIGSMLSGTVTAILSIFRIYLMIKGMLNAYNGRKEPMPFVGQYAEKF